MCEIRICRMDTFALNNNKMSICPPSSLDYRVLMTICSPCTLLKHCSLSPRCNATLCFVSFTYFSLQFLLFSYGTFWLFPDFANTKAVPFNFHVFISCYICASFSRMYAMQWSCWIVRVPSLGFARLGQMVPISSPLSST